MTFNFLNEMLYFCLYYVKVDMKMNVPFNDLHTYTQGQEGKK